MNSGIRVLLLAGLSSVTVGPALAQGPQNADGPPVLLRISREEVRVGKDAAHEALEALWASAYSKTQLPSSYLAMTSMTGPGEAWFLTGYVSWADLEKDTKAQEANEAYSAETKKLWAQDGELLSRASGIMASYRPAISYRAGSNLAKMRYMQVQLIRLKPGHVREFFDNWREIVAAHEKAKMEESWAFYQVVSGMPDGTYMYLQPHASLAEIDQSGPMHAADAYRNAVGEAGRARSLEATQVAIETSQTLYFAFNPKMSSAPKAWMDADPFWAPKPPPPAKPVAKK